MEHRFFLDDSQPWYRPDVVLEGQAPHCLRSLLHLSYETTWWECSSLYYFFSVFNEDDDDMMMMMIMTTTTMTILGEVPS